MMEVVSVVDDDDVTIISGCWILNKIVKTDMIIIINDNIILVDAAGTETNIARKDIAQLKPMETSGMPKGLQQQISVEEMKDLLSFLKEPF